jgi:hypothetical protein
VEQVIAGFLGHGIAALQDRAQLFSFDADALGSLSDGFRIEIHKREKLMKENLGDEQANSHGANSGNDAR